MTYEIQDTLSGAIVMNLATMLDATRIAARLNDQAQWDRYQVRQR